MLLFAYLGQKSSLECYGGSFSGVTCLWPRFIKVQSADYGRTSDENPSDTVCNPNDIECSEKVQDVNDVYYQTILTKCDGNQNCGDLTADWIDMPNCDKLSDYVEIFYRCVTGTLRRILLNWLRVRFCSRIHCHPIIMWWYKIKTSFVNCHTFFTIIN